MGSQRSYNMTPSPTVRFTKRKSEVTIVPSLQAVEKTAPNAGKCGDSLKTLCRYVYILWVSTQSKVCFQNLLLTVTSDVAFQYFAGGKEASIS